MKFCGWDFYRTAVVGIRPETGPFGSNRALGARPRVSFPVDDVTTCRGGSTGFPCSIRYPTFQRDRTLFAR